MDAERETVIRCHSLRSTTPTCAQKSNLLVKSRIKFPVSVRESCLVTCVEMAEILARKKQKRKCLKVSPWHDQSWKQTVFWKGSTQNLFNGKRRKKLGNVTELRTFSGWLRWKMDIFTLCLLLEESMPWSCDKDIDDTTRCTPLTMVAYKPTNTKETWVHQLKKLPVTVSVYQGRRVAMHRNQREFCVGKNINFCG